MDVVTYALAQKYVKNAIGSLDAVTDVTVDGNSVVNEDGVAEIVTPQILGEVADVKVDGQSVVDSEGVAQITLPDSANAISYDNSESGLDATNVQDAVDEVLDKANKVDDVQTYGGNTLVTNKIADLSALTMKKSIPSTPTAIATFADGAEMVMPSLKVAIEPVQEGSGDPSPTNIRPISGWDEVDVSVSGVNVWDEEWEVGGLNPLNGDTTVENDRIRSKNFNPCIPNANMFYYIPNNKGNLQIFFYDKNKTYLGYYNYSTTHTYETPTNCYFYKFNTGGSYGATYNNDISINYPSTDTEYHAYNGATYTIDLDGTRYGGRLDVVNGVLTVDRKCIDLGNDKTWYYKDSGSVVAPYFWASMDDAKFEGAPSLTDYNLMCTQYKSTRRHQSVFVNGCITFDGDNENVSQLQIKDDRYTDTTTFKNGVQGVKLVYKLKTPLTIQLTPTAVKSLLGTNNLWADSGEILEGEYIADASTVIAGLDARITALENA